MKVALLACLAVLLAAPGSRAMETAMPEVPEAARKLAMEGHELVHSGKYEPALLKFRAAWAGGSRSPLVAYNAGCAAARLGKADEAFEWLRQVVQSGWDDVAYLQKDEDLASIRADPRFATVVAGMKEAAAKAEAAVADKPLRDELVRRVDEHSQAWKALVDDGFRTEALKKKAETIAERNVAWFKTVLDKHGFPGRKLVGEKGAQAAFFLVLHAENERALQKKCLGLLEKSVKIGDASPRFLAYLTDRIRVAEGRQQVYGTQFMKAANGAQVPHPIEDAANVDERRSALGLPPLAVYTRMLREAGKSEPVKSEHAEKR